MVASPWSKWLIVIGLTGPIAGGKSTVAAQLAARGAEVIDCDQLARDATVPGSPVLASIVARFGPGVLQPDGALDRAALGRIVFGQTAALEALEALVHPAVTAAKDGRLRESVAEVAVIEAIKLLEAGYADGCDEVWVVTAAPEVRLRRLVESRGFDESAARQRIAAQTNLPAMLAAADRVLVNDGPPEELVRQVDQAWAALRA